MLGRLMFGMLTLGLSMLGLSLPPGRLPRSGSLLAPLPVPIPPVGREGRVVGFKPGSGLTDGREAVPGPVGLTVGILIFGRLPPEG